MATSQYIGRFAPSPTGPLHFGSLLAAMGSYLQSRSENGVWLLRIEDIDPPRQIPGAVDSIIRSLANFGFEWDGPTDYQSKHSERYIAALDSLRRDNRLYACCCSRRQIAERSTVNHTYPGTCRTLGLPEDGNALRIRVDGDIDFSDVIQGDIHESLPECVGDFVVKRRDGLFAYQLAVVVDDAEQKISEVVRGADLLDNTARQIFLQRQLGLPTPRYCHLPVAVNNKGRKLSKQNLAEPIDKFDTVESLLLAWNFLGQSRLDSRIDSIDDFWTQAISRWSLASVPRLMARPSPYFCSADE